MPEISQETDTRRQCWTCIKRRLVCDSQRPTCQRCKNAKIECRGYHDKKPLTWLEPGQVTSRKAYQQLTLHGQKLEWIAKCLVRPGERVDEIKRLCSQKKYHNAVLLAMERWNHKHLDLANSTKLCDDTTEMVQTVSYSSSAPPEFPYT